MSGTVVRCRLSFSCPFLSLCSEDPTSKEIEARPPIALPLDQLDAMHMPLHRAVGPAPPPLRHNPLGCR
jgi:hypothetical protein